MLTPRSVWTQPAVKTLSPVLLKQSCTVVTAEIKMRSEELVMLGVHMTVVWDMTPCTSINRYQRFLVHRFHCLLH